MCVTFLAVGSKERLVLGKYKLILVNNRDEFLARPTSALAWRDGILAGRDEEDPEKGTWLGIGTSGRVGNLLSITQPRSQLKKGAPSRGKLVNQYLKNECSTSASTFLTEFSHCAHEFNGFQFLALDRIDGFYELFSLTNQLGPVESVHWPPGVYGFGNSPRRTPFRKVVYGEKKFRELMDTFDLAAGGEGKLAEQLFELASDRTVHFPDEQIRQQTGAPEGSDLYKILCSIFIFDATSHHQGRQYGTRSSSIILVDADDNVAFHERQMLDPARAMDDPEKWAFSTQRFSIQQPPTDIDG